MGDMNFYQAIICYLFGSADTSHYYKNFKFWLNNKNRRALSDLFSVKNLDTNIEE